jgi:cell wall-associated NlpC family hydrolase
LTDLAENLTGHVSAMGRTGAILAMTSGLITTMTPQASAAPPTTAAAETTVTDIPDAPAAAQTVTAEVLARLNDPRLRASADARVRFDRAFFDVRQAPKPKPEPAVKKSRNSAGSGSATKGSAVLRVAARYVGIPYVYGGTTPSGFDCSGFTRYVYAQLGRSLPRTADQQMRATQRISRSQARPGDLVSFVRGGRAYHIGIYAGDGMMYDSPRSGKRISRRAIWTSAVVFSRVG